MDYYKHPVFSNYAASKNGDILSLKFEKILKMRDNGSGYIYFSICDKKLCASFSKVIRTLAVLFVLHLDFFKTESVALL